MKNYFGILIILFISFVAEAQTQPIEKVVVDPDPVIMDSYDYATGRMNDVKWMFKLAMDDGPRVGFEYNLWKSLSINSSTRWSILNVNIFGVIDSNLGLRYYWGKANRVELKQQGNNLNGSYTELGVRFIGGREWVSPGNEIYINGRPFVSIGLQSRFLKRGLIDTGVKVEYQVESKIVRITSGFDLGIALSSGYKLQDVENNKCAVVRCFDEQFYMFKTQISRLFDITFSKQYTAVRFRPNFELEHRISKVGLSINHEIVADFNFKEQSSLLYGDYVVGEVVFRSGIRWYVGKKRRIIKGKTSNNLSGFYLGPIGDIGILTGEFNGTKLNNGEFWSAGFNLGYQTRLLKNLYIKFNMGAMYREYFNNDPINITIFSGESNYESSLLKIVIEDNSELKLIGGLVVGYAF